MDQAQRAALLVAEVVRVVERVAHLEQHVDRDRHRHRPDGVVGLAEDLAQVAPGDHLHRDEVDAVDLTQVVGLRDVGVAQLRRQPGFAHERLHELGIAGEPRQHPLERHQALEALDAGLLRAVHRRHAASSQALEEHVGTEGLGRFIAARFAHASASVAPVVRPR